MGPNVAGASGQQDHVERFRIGPIGFRAMPARATGYVLQTRISYT
jgi:hypothetical protein